MSITAPILSHFRGAIPMLINHLDHQVCLSVIHSYIEVSDRSDGGPTSHDAWSAWFDVDAWIGGGSASLGVAGVCATPPIVVSVAHQRR